ncbi:hypothetical protein GCM10017673_54280 [Streptosporangium violaceochromogenes]|nr:hypothetical protein GCM10017673_54280 [Streptosporangium violaceochromogenes]
MASWLPVKKDLTPHGLRHGHKVWLDEDDIPAVASEERLGHELPGIIGTYSHTSPEMIHRIVSSLQARWEGALRGADRPGRWPLPCAASGRAAGTLPADAPSTYAPKSLPLRSRRSCRQAQKMGLTCVGATGFEPVASRL